MPNRARNDTNTHTHTRTYRLRIQSMSQTFNSEQNIINNRRCEAKQNAREHTQTAGMRPIDLLYTADTTNQQLFLFELQTIGAHRMWFFFRLLLPAPKSIPIKQNKIQCRAKKSICWDFLMPMKVWLGLDFPLTTPQSFRSCYIRITHVMQCWAMLRNIGLHFIDTNKLVDVERVHDPI